ncbi:MAG: ribosomal protein methyltransferase [Segetibacter sp.]|nr:ribosomal protein methyltransferase [Segetibacter sp.]
MNETVQIAIAADDDQVREQLIAQLSAIDFDAFEEKDNELVAFIDSNNFDASLLEDTLSVYNLNYTKTIIEEQNWNALWESNFQPVVVDDFCAIRADFHPPFNDTQHEIIITPKMSFGTGHHATTYMMISEMSKLDFKNKRAADFGTGTGVLAILAEKLGSEYVWAIDIDDWSIENATENIEKNNCKNIIIEKTDRFNSREKFDIILANINKNVILLNVDDVLSGTKPAGQILLSGLLKEDEQDVLSAFAEKGYTHQSTIEKNKWICLLLQYDANSR